MLQRAIGVRSILAVLLCAALLVSCSSGVDNDDPPVAEAYILVIDWVLAAPEFVITTETDKLAVVYIESLGPAEIELSVQVEVVTHFEDQTDIRFIDARTEAVEEEMESSPVRAGGLLLGLHAVPVGESWDVRGEIYQSAERVVGYRFQVDQTAQAPVMNAPPTRVEPEGLVADQ